jgi:aspartate carbamoyltransferase regulatory subunit
VAPNVVLNEIRNYVVVDKKRVSLPEELVGIVKCNNPCCISNNEPMQSRFAVIDREHVTLKCHYCERTINKEDILIN